MKCPSTATILAYRHGTLGKPEHRKIEAHLQHCELCAELTRVGIPPLTSALKKRAADTGKAIGQKAPANHVPGQLWSIAAPGFEPEFGVVTCDERGSLNPSAPDVRVSMVTIDPRPDQIDEDDIIGEAADSPLGRPFLVEYWNDWPVTADALQGFHGNVSRTIREALLQRLSGSAGKSSTVAPMVQIFRDARVRKASVFLSPALGKALGGTHGTTEIILGPAANERLKQTGRDAVGVGEDPLIARLMNELEKRPALPVKFRRAKGGICFRAKYKGQEFTLVFIGNSGRELLRLESSDGTVEFIPERNADWKKIRAEIRDLARLKIISR